MAFSSAWQDHMVAIQWYIMQGAALWALHALRSIVTCNQAQQGSCHFADAGYNCLRILQGTHPWTNKSLFRQLLFLYTCYICICTINTCIINDKQGSSMLAPLQVNRVPHIRENVEAAKGTILPCLQWPYPPSEWWRHRDGVGSTGIGHRSFRR